MQSEFEVNKELWKNDQAYLNFKSSKKKSKDTLTSYESGLVDFMKARKLTTPSEILAFTEKGISEYLVELTKRGVSYSRLLNCYSAIKFLFTQNMKGKNIDWVWVFEQTPSEEDILNQNPQSEQDYRPYEKAESKKMLRCAIKKKDKRACALITSFHSTGAREEGLGFVRLKHLHSILKCKICETNKAGFASIWYEEELVVDGKTGRTKTTPFLDHFLQFHPQEGSQFYETKDMKFFRETYSDRETGRLYYIEIYPNSPQYYIALTTPQATKYIDEMLEERPKIKYGLGKGKNRKYYHELLTPESFLFVPSKTNLEKVEIVDDKIRFKEPLSSQQIADTFIRIHKDKEVDIKRILLPNGRYDLQPVHSFRRTTSTIMKASGVNDAIAERLLGHSEGVKGTYWATKPTQLLIGNAEQPGYLKALEALTI